MNSIQSSQFVLIAIFEFHCNALLSIICELNSHVVIDSFYDVDVSSSNGMKGMGRINIYIIVLRCCKVNINNSHSVQMHLDTLIDPIATQLT